MRKMGNIHPTLPMADSLNPQATPKTLDEAIHLAIFYDNPNSIPDNLYFRIKDFLAQRFGVTFLEAAQKDSKTWLKPDPEELLKNLWVEISKR